MSLRKTNFDTLQYMNTLKQSGLTQEISEGITTATSTAFQTMLEEQDICKKSDLKEWGSSLTYKIDHVSGTLDSKIDKVFSKLDSKIEGSLYSMKAFIVVTALTIIGSIAALQTLFHYINPH